MTKQETVTEKKSLTPAEKQKAYRARKKLDSNYRGEVRWENKEPFIKEEGK